IQMALNSTLPKDISISLVKEMPPGFHAQYSCKSKIYQYNILNRIYPSALLRGKAWHIPFKLNIKMMKAAAVYLLGEHDFSVFSKSDRDVKNKVRTVINVGLKKTRKGIVEFEIEADGFLKRMVRLIMGTLVEVGKEKIEPHEFKEILNKGEKNKHVISAPPEGLFLKKVKY
ncbi:MAG: tRNA pseudouridine synthase A, partial [Thermodesulfobacteriota bacterium]